MAKVGELTVGIVTKVMTQVGWTITDRLTGEVKSKQLFNSYAEAEEWCSGDVNPGYLIKPLYIEEAPRSYPSEYPHNLRRQGI